MLLYHVGSPCFRQLKRSEEKEKKRATVPGPAHQPNSSGVPLVRDTTVLSIDVLKRAGPAYRIIRSVFSSFRKVLELSCLVHLVFFSFRKVLELVFGSSHFLFVFLFCFVSLFLPFIFYFIFS
jgi:hypothetical protein